MPSLVSPTLWRLTWLSMNLGSVRLSIVGWMIVWVSAMSFRARCCRYRTMFSAPRSLVAFTPDHTHGAEPNAENFMFM